MPDAPGSDEGIRRWARRQGWEIRTVVGRGGPRIEYLIPDEFLSVRKPETLDVGADCAALAAQTWRDELQARFHRFSDRKKNKAIEQAMALRIWRGLDDAPEGACRLSARALWRKWSIVKDYARRIGQRC